MHSIQIELPWKFVNKMLFFKKVYFLLDMAVDGVEVQQQQQQPQRQMTNSCKFFFLSCESCYLYELRVHAHMRLINKR